MAAVSIQALTKGWRTHHLEIFRRCQLQSSTNIWSAL